MRRQTTSEAMRELKEAWDEFMEACYKELVVKHPVLFFAWMIAGLLIMLWPADRQ